MPSTNKGEKEQRVKGDTFRNVTFFVERDSNRPLHPIIDNVYPREFLPQGLNQRRRLWKRENNQELLLCRRSVAHFVKLVRRALLWIYGMPSFYLPLVRMPLIRSVIMTRGYDRDTMHKPRE
jgi:hypothetical protein